MARRWKLTCLFLPILILAVSKAQDASGTCVGNCNQCYSAYCTPAIVRVWKALSLYSPSYDNQVLYPRAHLQINSSVYTTGSIVWNFTPGQGFSDVPTRGPYDFCSLCTSVNCSDAYGNLYPPCRPSVFTSLRNQQVSPLVWYYAVYYGRCVAVPGVGVRGIVISQYEYGTAFFNALKSLLDSKVQMGLISKDTVQRTFPNTTMVRRYHIYGGGGYRQALVSALSATHMPQWYSLAQLTANALPEQEEDLIIILGDILSPSDLTSPSNNNNCNLCELFEARFPTYNPYESLALFGVNPVYDPLQYAPKLRAWRDFWLSLFSIVPSYAPCSQVRGSALVSGEMPTFRTFGDSYGYTLDSALSSSGYLIRDGFFRYGELVPLMNFDLPGFPDDDKPVGLIYTLYLDTCSSGLHYIAVMGRMVTWALFTVWFALTLRNTVAKIADSSE